jgi:ribosomal protein S18 acetylase RimI-like enzyme
MIVHLCDTEEGAMITRPWILRPFEAASDTEAVQRIDTSYVTSESYQVRSDGRRLELEPVAEDSQLTRTYTIDLGADDWQHAHVAVLDGAVRGFVAWAEQGWNRRLAIWHFYVDRPVRRLGAGRLMMDMALGWAAQRRLLTAWVETSNANLPGIASYRRLGFEICGFDTTLYRGTPGPNEFAIYMAREVAEPRAAAP